MQEVILKKKAPDAGFLVQSVQIVLIKQHDLFLSFREQEDPIILAIEKEDTT